MINCEYKKLSYAERKMARFLTSLESSEPLFLDYLSYKREVGNNYCVMSIKIDGESYYRDRFKRLCEIDGIAIDILAKHFNFPKTVIIEISDHLLPFAKMYVYFGEDNCEETEYDICLNAKSRDSIETIIEDIKDLWRI